MPKAIPKHLLVHSCVLKKPTGLDRNRTPIYAQTILKQVRIGAKLQSIRGAYGEIKGDSLTLFIETKNSCYENADGEVVERKLPTEKDVVEWQGQVFTVRSITPCYTQDDAPHHWEVTLE